MLGGDAPRALGVEAWSACHDACRDLCRRALPFNGSGGCVLPRAVELPGMVIDAGADAPAAR